MKKILLLLTFYMATNSLLKAATITVCASGCDQTTIAAAVAAASAGDIIDVQDATHTEEGITIDKNLTIQGQGQTTTTVRAADMQSNATNRVFTVNTGLTVTFQNMTIQNGKSSTDGGGVHITCNGSTNVTFTNVTLDNNLAENSQGGGVYITGASGTVTFTNCVIKDNETANISGSLGGGIYSDGTSTLNFTRCTVSGNSCGVSGAGIRNEGSGTMKLINCTIYNNTAGTSATNISRGGGVYFAGTVTTDIINCTIVNNSVTNGTLREGGGVYYGANTTANFTNSIIANNMGVTAGGGNDVYGNTTSNSETTSLAEDCAGDCPVFDYSSDANIAASASTCGNHSYFDVAGSDAENNGTAPGGDIPSADICGTAVVSVKEIGSYETANVLPVELIYFQGRSTAKGVLLTWQTASETNNKGFEIEWSTSGSQSAVDSWQSVGLVHGAGDSFENQSYSFLHENPRAEVNYYRLKQKDYDGAFEYSPVVSVDLTNLKDLSNLSIVPNPTQNGSFTLYLPENVSVLDEAETVEMTLYDYTGRAVRQMNLTQSQTEVNVSDLENGIYLIKAEIGREVSWARVILQ